MLNKIISVTNADVVDPLDNILHGKIIRCTKHFSTLYCMGKDGVSYLLKKKSIKGSGTFTEVFIYDVFKNISKTEFQVAVSIKDGREHFDKLLKELFLKSVSRKSIARKACDDISKEYRGLQFNQILSDIPGVMEMGTVVQLEVGEFPVIVALSKVYEKDLYSHIQSISDNNQGFTGIEILGDELVWKWMGQLLGALQGIHARGYVHRDLKFENILLTRDMDLNICDFGFTSKKQTSNGSGNISPRNCGSPATAHTDLFHEISELSFVKGVKYDLFALGMMMYYIATFDFESYEKLAFFRLTNTARGRVHSTLRSKIHEKIEPKLAGFICRLLKSDFSSTDHALGSWNELVSAKDNAAVLREVESDPEDKGMRCVGRSGSTVSSGPLEVDNGSLVFEFDDL